jgi:hypothetical protein
MKVASVLDALPASFRGSAALPERTTSHVSQIDTPV